MPRRRKEYPNMSEWRMDSKMLEGGIKVYYPYRVIDLDKGDSTAEERRSKVRQCAPGRSAYTRVCAPDESNRLHPVMPMMYETPEECQHMIEWLEDHPEVPTGKWKTRKLCGECRAFKCDMREPRKLIPGVDIAVRLGVCALSGKPVERCQFMDTCPCNDSISPILEH